MFEQTQMTLQKVHHHKLFDLFLLDVTEVFVSDNVPLNWICIDGQIEILYLVL